MSTAFTPPTQQQVPKPNLANVIAAKIQQALLSTNCHEIGIVQSFNEANQSATVQIVLFRNVPTPNPKFLPASSEAEIIYIPTPYPLLTNVPVACWGGGGCSLTFPIAAGDECLVCFNDRCFDSWWANGTTATPPNVPRYHDLSDGIALVGVRSIPNALTGYSTTDAVLQNQTQGSQIALGAHIRIANTSSSILTILNNIISALNIINTAGFGGTTHTAGTPITAAQTGTTALFKT